MGAGRGTWPILRRSPAVPHLEPGPTTGGPGPDRTGAGPMVDRGPPGLEDRVLHNLAAISERSVNGVRGRFTPRHSRPGSDQAAAVAAVQSGTSPTDPDRPRRYGKTTTLAAAVKVMAGASRPVLAVASTNQAVEQLAPVGIPGHHGGPVRPGGRGIGAGHDGDLRTRCPSFPPGKPTSCSSRWQAARSGQVWLVGDPQQAQPVGAGGLAHDLTAENPTGRRS